jgi:hypothetical protein
MTTITLYECDLCYLVQDFHSISKLFWGGGGLHMDPDTFYFYFYNMNFNTHALEKISAYFYMAHPYDCN